MFGLVAVNVDVLESGGGKVGFDFGRSVCVHPVDDLLSFLLLPERPSSSLTIRNIPPGAITRGTSAKDFPFGGDIHKVKAPGGHLGMGTAVHAGNHHFASETLRFAGIAEDFAENAHDYFRSFADFFSTFPQSQKLTIATAAVTTTQRTRTQGF